MIDDGMSLGVLEHDAVVTLWDVAVPGQTKPVLKNQGHDITASNGCHYDASLWRQLYRVKRTAQTNHSVAVSKQDY